MDATPALSPSLPAADLLPVQRQATLTFRVARFLVGGLLRALFSLRIEGRERSPRGAYVLIANHLNWLDSLVILLLFPAEPRIHFLGDPRGLIGRRFQWWLVRHAGGYLCVDRSQHRDARLFHHADLCLERGGVVALFPEGVYGDVDGALQPLHKGFAHFAVDNGVPVLPVGLSGTKHLWLRRRVTVTVGELIPWEGLDVETMMTAGERGLRAVLHPEQMGHGPRLFRRRLTNLL